MADVMEIVMSNVGRLVPPDVDSDPDECVPRRRIVCFNTLI